MQGLKISEGLVRAEWIDINDHMNVAYYLLAFDLAVDAMWTRLGITDDSIRRTRNSTFAVETHITYQGELRENDPYVVTTELLAYDQKRIHQFQRMYHGSDGYLAATAEWMSLHVNLERRRVTAWPAGVLDALDAIAQVQQGQRTGKPPDELCGRMQVRGPIYSRY